MSISVIIPVYKNKEQFLSNLSHNLPFLKNCEIIVVNDNPEESLINDLKQFKEVILVENAINMGFGSTVNVGAKKATRDYLFLLNTDVVLFDMNYAKALEDFKSNTPLFGVSFAQKERDGKTIGKNRIYWKSGFFYHGRAADLSSGYNGWAEGGSCLIDRSKFMEIGGFDSIYAPFYWEDTDLSYRAWKRGFTVLFRPDILVEHHHESTIGKYFTKDRIRAIDFRNQLLFIWKNITDVRMLIAHLFYLKLLLLKYTLKGEWFYIKGYIQALAQLPKALSHRQREIRHFTKSDSDILSLFYE